MHYFELRNFQHVMLYVFPTLLFVVLFAIGLGYSHFRGRDSENNMRKIVHRYPTGIEERNAPFPLILILTLAGTVIWALLYIILYGVLEVRI